MKIKALPNETHSKKRFFLLMIAPLLLGLLITLTTSAHAEWNKKSDPLPHKSPSEQGWTQMQTRGIVSDDQKDEALL